MKELYILIITCIAVTIAHAQNILKVHHGAELTTTGATIITLVDMDLSNDGEIRQGSFIFKGSGNNVISGITVPQFASMEIAKTGGSKITLQQGIQTVGGITFTSGIIELNGNNILLQSNALLKNESATSYIDGDAGGYVQITRALNAPVSVNAGNLGAVITSTKDLGNVVIRRNHQSQTNSFNNGKSILRNYTILPDNNTDLDATLRIIYLGRELNGLDENLLTMWSKQGSTQWIQLGFTERNASANFVEQKSINSFSQLTLTEASNSLPLVWGSFNTVCSSGQARISWNTMREQNTAVFIIRRSSNGRIWNEIGSLPASGNTQSSIPYTFTDQHPLSGAGYYQVLQRDVDGRETLSPVLVSQCGLQEVINAYPNPVYDKFVVSIQSDGSHPATMRLYDSRGVLMQQQAVALQSGNNQYVLQMKNYTPGIYSLAITWNGKIKVIKLEKN